MATTDYTYTLAAWTAVAGVAGAAYYFWPAGGKRKQKIASTKQSIKKKLGGEDTLAREAGNVKEKAPKKKKRDNVNTVGASTTPQVQSTTQGRDDSRDDEELNNREFARQIQNAQLGTIAVSQSKANSRPKSVKQSKAATASPSVPIVDGNDTAGADGDDDFSATNSPTLAATNLRAPQSGDVSDMLETPRSGPSIMRITESTRPAQPKMEKKPVKEEVKETKKQRQNRKKTEERKLAKEEDEKERRILMEKQLRTARQAEGRPAKDGSSFMAAKAPASSAWTGPPTNENNSNSNGFKASTDKEVPMLDTYEPKRNALQETSNLKATTSSKASSDWEVLPSEEEQMRLLSEDSEWKPVKAKKGKKEGKSVETSAAEITQATKKPAPPKNTSSFSALKDEGSELKDEDATALWEEGKGWTKLPPPGTKREPQIHTFTYLNEDGTTGKMVHRDPSKEDEWEVS